MSGAPRTRGMFGDQPDARGNRARAALWSTYFHRFHNHWSSHSGESGPQDEIPPRYRPLSPNQAMRVLNEQARQQGGLPRSVLRGAASQVLWSRYELDEEGERQLADLVVAAEDGAPAEEAFRRFRVRGDHFQRAHAGQQPGVHLDDRTRIELVPGSGPAGETCHVRYVEVRCTGILTVLAYEIELARSLEEVAPVIDPRSWPIASPAFLEVRLVEPASDPGPCGRAAWHGSYFEHVAVNWNTLSLNSFQVTLKAEVSVDPFEVRCDFSLIREKHWQLANDYGFLRVRRHEGMPGSCVVSAEKCVSYRSPWLNFMSPAVMSMVAGQWAEAIRDFADRAAPRSLVA